jgi:ferredoxin
MLKYSSSCKCLLAGSVACLFGTLALASPENTVFAGKGPAAKAMANFSILTRASSLQSQPARSWSMLAGLQDAPAATTANLPSTSTSVRREPFSFSHKRHALMSLDCSFCHEDSQTGARAGFPAAQTCMTCHVQIAKDADPIKKLASFPADTRIVPEKPLYKLPDYAYFSHVRHKEGNIDCSACHGDVWQTDVVELKRPMRMKACVDCHREDKAPLKCNSCHELFQQ